MIKELGEAYWDYWSQVGMPGALPCTEQFKEILNLAQQKITFQLEYETPYNSHEVLALFFNGADLIFQNKSLHSNLVQIDLLALHKKMLPKNTYSYLQNSSFATFLQNEPLTKNIPHKIYFNIQQWTKKPFNQYCYRVYADLKTGEYLPLTHKAHLGINQYQDIREYCTWKVNRKRQNSIPKSCRSEVVH